MLNIGFTGSRIWVHPHKRRVELLVHDIFDNLQLKAGDFIVHVGDAYGVDDMVVRVCLSRKIPLIVYGVHGRCRNLEGRTIDSALVSLRYCEGDYLDRDREVAKVDKLYAIWNSESRGTKYTYDHARKIGTKTFLVTWQEQKWKWTI